MPTRRLISRTDLDAGRLNFVYRDSSKRLQPVRPGDVLRHDFLAPLGLSAHAVALRVPPNRITTILAGERTVTAATALRLARHFGTSPSFRINLEKSYELEVAERTTGERIRAEVAPALQHKPRRTHSRDRPATHHPPAAASRARHRCRAHRPRAPAQSIVPPAPRAVPAPDSRAPSPNDPPQ